MAKKKHISFGSFLGNTNRNKSKLSVVSCKRSRCLSNSPTEQVLASRLPLVLPHRTLLVFKKASSLWCCPFSVKTEHICPFKQTSGVNAAVLRNGAELKEL